jgi:hypothetical protein
MPTPTPEPSSAAARGSALGPRVGAAAAIAIGVAVALRLMGGATPTPEVGSPSVVNAPDPASVDPARWLAAFPLEPLEAPASVGNTPSARALNTALEPYRKGDYVAAATALDGFLLDHPGDPVATLYLGISRLFMDEPQNALEILRGMPGSASEQMMVESEWYSVVGAARLRDPSAAEGEARTLCERKGPASARACAALERLGTERQKAKG